MIDFRFKPLCWGFCVIVGLAMMPSSLWSQEAFAKKESLARTESTVFLVKDQPFFARVIQHNGESFAFLKSLGFNTVQLPACATQQQLEEAQATGIWLVCPPPSSIGLDPIPFSFDPVVAWFVADNSSARHAQLIRETIREIQSSERRTGRPIVAGIASHCETLCQLVDVPVIGHPTANSSFRANDYSQWISARTRTTSKPFWVDLPTHVPTGLNPQVLAMSSARSMGEMGAVGIQPTNLPLTHQQLKFLLYEAIAGGGRGIRFRSKQRLDVIDPVAQLRASTLLWLMNHLDQIESWISGGLLQQLPSPDRTVSLSQIRLADSKLILAQRSSGMDQYLAGGLPTEKLSINNLPISVTDRVYRIDELGATLAENQQSTTGTRVILNQDSPTSATLITQSPGPVAIVNQATAQPSGASPLQIRLQLAEQSLAWAQLVRRQFTQPPAPSAQNALRSAIQQMQISRQMNTLGNEVETLRNLRSVDRQLSYVHKTWLESRFDPDDGITTSPLLVHVGLLPYHDEVSQRLTGLQWNPNALTAGDFEDLGQMQAAGWVNRREDLPQIKTLVTLDKAATVDGRYGLKMTAQTKSAMNFVPAPPVWIRSSDVAVKAGQLVRIHGYINVPAELQGSHDGLMIIDSLGGVDLASRVRRTEGWKEFSVYRAAARDGRVNVKLVLTGLGTALIDELTIRTLDLTSSGNQARKPVPTFK